MRKATDPTPTLWHYTCAHGHLALGYDRATLVPAAQLVVAHDRTHLLPAQGHLVWLTDLDRPLREGLGLTSHLTNCDRTAHRYRVLDGTACEWWPVVARRLPSHVRMELEQAEGALPAHWWVSFLPVPVVFNPVPKRSPLAQP